LDFIILGRKMKAVFYVTTLGKQVISLGLPWLESADPDISWRNCMLRWRHAQAEISSASSEHPSHEPMHNLAISYVKGVATKETQLQWVKSRMNKASLFAYNKDKAEMEEKQKKMLEEQVPHELHKYLQSFQTTKHRECHNIPNMTTRSS
jgi:glucose-6-phosphate dehydrogenase assembly protein OpcA